ncbi:7741_t:CDS:2 [Funneliformis geosporum]|nr:7741_t:CDS:2 [Funneliformis geosporum]
MEVDNRDKRQTLSGGGHGKEHVLHKHITRSILLPQTCKINKINKDDDGHKDEEPYHAGIIVDDNEILHLSKENNILKENLELNVKKLNFALQVVLYNQ